MPLRTRIVSLATVALLLALTHGTSQAQVVKPFKITGSGIAPHGLPLPGQLPRMHWIIGQATHLGRHYGEGTVKVDSAAPNPDTGKIEGEFGSATAFVFTAANGDQLATYYGNTNFGADEPGTFELTILGVTPDNNLIVEALFIADFVIQPALCTGRFAGTTGSWLMIARSAPFVLGSSDPLAYSWEGEGRLTFRRGR